MSSWFVTASRSPAREWPAPDPSARSFHASLPGYAPTPLVVLSAEAEAWGVGRIYVKDESARFDLGAFKFLGASWAAFRALAERSGFTGGYDLAELRDHLAASTPISLTTATDGNHGRAVARMARLLGVPARVFVPHVVPQVVLDRIVAEGAELVSIAGDYDETVAAVTAAAGDDPTAVLVQDTAWEGYEVVPGWIVDGYETLFSEVDDALEGQVPDLVLVPVGVGSLAQAALAHYAALPTRIVSVEPDTAACVLQSLASGEPTSVTTADTVMNGLNCGTPSTLAWPWIEGRLDAAVAVTDAECEAAVAALAAQGICSGPSGAASYAGLAALLDPAEATGGSACVETRRARLGLGPDAVVVCISTEGPLRA